MAHPEWRTPVLAASSASQSLSVLSGNLCWNLSATPRAEASCRRSAGAGTGALDERVVATVLACAGSIPSHSEKICRSRTRLKMQGRSGNAIVVAMRRLPVTGAVFWLFACECVCVRARVCVCVCVCVSVCVFF